MAGRSRKTSLDEADDVLAGRRPARMEELFDLIHAVNPTGQELAERKRSEAYAIKARLQSMLIERFGEMLVVEEVEGSSDGVVGLRHRTYAKDACHAVVAELSALAQRWVRLQRDLEADAEADAPPDHSAAPREPVRGETLPSAGSLGLLALGEAALAEYDFERARELFSQALSGPVTWADGLLPVRAARALLDVLVDRLGDDEAALALHERLPPAAAQDDQVRCLLALAAARQGARAMAEKLVVGMDSERAHEVLLVLARSALAAGDAGECEHHLARIPPGSEHIAQARSVADAAGRLRAEQARPLEEDLAAVLASGDLASGDLARVERLARELLAVHAASEVAHRALAAVRHAQQARTVAELGAQLEKALDALDVAGAVALLQQIESLQGPRADLRARLAAVSEAGALARERAQTEALGRALQEELTPRVVEMFWEAGAAVRQAVLQRVARAQLAWLEELGPVKGNAGCAAAAAAAMALPRAEQELVAGRAASAEAMAALHEELARASSRGRDLLQRVHAAATAERRRAALARLAELEGSAATDDASRTLQLLASVASSDLDDEGRARREALEERLRRSERAIRVRRERRRRVAGAAAVVLVAAGLVAGMRACAGHAPPAHRSDDEMALESAERRGDLLDARAAAARLVQATTGAQRSTWLARREALSQQVRDRYIEAEDSGPSVDRSIGDLWPRVAAGTSCVWVAAEGDAFVAAEQRGQHLFVRSFHRDPSRSRAVVMRVPEPFRIESIHVEDHTLAVLGREQMLTMDPDTLDILGGLNFAPLSSEGRPTGARFVPGRRHLWIDWVRPPGLGALLGEGKEIMQGTTVVSRDNAATVRSLMPYRALAPLWGLEPPAVVLSRALTDFALVDDSGKPLWHEKGDYLFHTAVVHPSGNAFVVLKSRPRAMAEGSGFQLTAQTFSIAGKHGQELPVAWLPRGHVSQAATALAEGCMFVVAETGFEQNTLISLRAQGESLVEAWREQVAPYLILAQDAQSRHVVAFSNDGESARWMTLTAARPDERRSRVPWPQTPPLLDPYQGCAWMPTSLRQRIAAYQAVLALMTSDEAMSRVRAWIEGADLLTGVALWFSGPRALRSGLLERLRQQHGRAPEVCLLVAGDLLHAAKPREALAALAGLDAHEAEPSMARHAAHLRAICHLVLGQEGAAKVDLDAALPLAPEACALQPLVEWIDAVQAPLDELLGDVHGATRRALVARLRAADRELARGDLEAARTWLDHPAAWAFPDVQGLARLAEAYLRLAPRDPALRMRQRYVLACLTTMMAAPLATRRVSLGSASWSRARLDEVAERARAWLGDRAPPASQAPMQEQGNESAGPDTPAVITTSVPPGLRATPAVLLRDPQSAQALLRHEPDLRKEARDLLAGGWATRLVGLVLDPAWPGAEHYQRAREQLRGTHGIGPEVALVVSLEEAFRLLADWPELHDRFQTFNTSSIVAGELSILLLRPDGAAWRRTRL